MSARSAGFDSSPPPRRLQLDIVPTSAQPHGVTSGGRVSRDNALPIADSLARKAWLLKLELGVENNPFTRPQGPAGA